MKERSKKPPTPEDEELEREIRSGRKFSVAEAIGREAGDLLKGASPVTRKRQVELEISHFLEEHLSDSEGALRVVLLRRVRESEVLLATHYEDALTALRRVTEHIVDSDTRLLRFVTSVDAEWGRMYSERPFFQRASQPPHSNDPYSVESVKEKLLGLLKEHPPIR